jgi:predicted double-glycine peptidase
MKKVVRLTESDLARIVKRTINESKGKKSISEIIDHVLSKFEFSEKGNDEMITLANYLLTPSGAENIARSIYSNLKKGHGANDDDNNKAIGIYTSNRNELKSLEDKLKRKK